eukprot:CAMPEP_0185765650 /NCGR_PEP_ID=MMETSP1174-20130828/31000_1 /TAXON_ID=35687 /ORGANISM="Dictyocha speculum, Strain CCMP1381" /LENGTH=290 /DNA_ID=CAMNT_0028448911 /DNA_START=28 /DNA_END=900 /DNA_ORIENTATION=-
MKSFIMTTLLPLSYAFQTGRVFQSVHTRAKVEVRGAMEMRTPFIAGNWKENPVTLQDATSLAESLKPLAGSLPCEVGIAVPYPFISAVAGVLEGTDIQVMAQSIHFEDSGAFTGAVAATMVESVGCSYSLAGHSERRSVFGDSDAVVNSKVKKILETKMGAILCIGETQGEFEAGLTNEVNAIQLSKGLSGVSAEDMSRVVIAYEPVWAIGTGLVCPSDTAQLVHESIRAQLAKLYSSEIADSVRIQYGGSVTPDSVDELMSKPDIDGCLVGGASLVAEKFGRIMNFEES